QPPVKEKKRVLITRTFSLVISSPSIASNPNHVSFKDPSKDSNAPTPGNSLGSNHGFPFPPMSGKASAPPSAMKQFKPPKTINFAVALIISIPNTAPSVKSPDRASFHSENLPGAL